MAWPPAATRLGELSAALAHVLPAYMRAVLGVPLDAVQFTVLESLLAALAPPDAAALQSHAQGRTGAQLNALVASAEERFAALTAALDSRQKALVTEFLELVAPVFDDGLGDNPARRALERYWAKPAADS